MNHKLSILNCSLCLLFFAISQLSAQDIVQNGGFENFYACPEKLNLSPNEAKIAPSWSSASNGTPDLFNRCSDNFETGISNFCGVTNPYEGKGFAGITTWQDDGYREYLINHFAEPLVRDQLYEVKFYYQLSTYSMYSIDRMSMYLADSIPYAKHDKHLSLKSTHTKTTPSALSPATGSWEAFTYTYRAKGGEKMILIGNLSDNRTTKTMHLKWKHEQEPELAHAAYYYIDALSITPIYYDKGEDTTAQTSPIVQKIVIEDPQLVLPKVYFDFDKSLLLPSSKPALDKVVTFLKTNSNYQIEIQGHTDSKGSVLHNQQLSEERASAVGYYLIKNGIDKNRIKSIGFGASKPLGSDDKVNRRVEIVYFGSN